MVSRGVKLMTGQLVAWAVSVVILLPWSRLITVGWCQSDQSYTGCRRTMLASRQFVWSKPYKRGSRAEQNDRKSEKSDKCGTERLCPVYSDPIDIENSQIYDTIKKNVADKPPVPRLQRMPLKDRSNTSNLNIKEMSKKRSKSLSGFSNKKIFSNNESGKLNFTGLCGLQRGHAM